MNIPLFVEVTERGCFLPKSVRMVKGKFLEMDWQSVSDRYNIMMKTLQFEWDPNKNQINKRKHGLSFETAKEVFYDEFALLFDDPDHSRRKNGFSSSEWSRHNRSALWAIVIGKMKTKFGLFQPGKQPGQSEKPIWMASEVIIWEKSIPSASWIQERIPIQTSWKNKSPSTLTAAPLNISRDRPKKRAFPIRP